MQPQSWPSKRAPRLMPVEGHYFEMYTEALSLLIPIYSDPSSYWGSSYIFLPFAGNLGKDFHLLDFWAQGSPKLKDAHGNHQGRRTEMVAEGNGSRPSAIAGSHRRRPCDLPLLPPHDSHETRSGSGGGMSLGAEGIGNLGGKHPGLVQSPPLPQASGVWQQPQEK